MLKLYGRLRTRVDVDSGKNRNDANRRAVAAIELVTPMFLVKVIRSLINQSQTSPSSRVNPINNE